MNERPDVSSDPTGGLNSKTTEQICKPDAVLARLILPKKVQPGLSYVPSQFVLPFTHDGEHYVFHMLTKQCLKTQLPSVTHAGAGYDSLIESMFLVPEGTEECAYYLSVSAMMRLFTHVKGVRNFMILPTLGCKHAAYIVMKKAVGK